MATLVTDYNELASKVKPGDVVAVKATGFYRFLLELGCMGPYGHVGIVDIISTGDGTQRPFLIQENPGGGAIVPFDFYCEDELDICRYHSNTLDLETSVPYNALFQLQYLPCYNYSEILDLVWLGVRRRVAKIFGKTLPTMPVLKPTKGQICSVFVTNALYASGVYLTNTVYPSAVVEALNSTVINYKPN